MKEPELAVPVTIVKTTSVNIASVVPVRNRLASGYAMEMRRSGASRRDRPSTAMTARSSRSALYMIVHTAPTTTIRPATIHVVKSMCRGPKTSSHTFQGSIHITTSTTPATVNVTRSATPALRATGIRLTSTSEMPNISGVALLDERPATVSSPPTSSPAAAVSQRCRPPRTRDSGRLRIAAAIVITLTRRADRATTASVSSMPIA